MKKLATLLILLFAVFTLSACENSETEDEKFKIENFSIISIQTLIEDRVQYNSIYNADSTNTTLFESTKGIITEYEFDLLEEPTTCDTDTLLEVTVVTNKGNLNFSKQCVVIDEVDTIITYVEVEDQLAYTTEDLYDELRELF